MASALIAIDRCTTHQHRDRSNGVADCRNESGVVVESLVVDDPEC
jgi:hypothetical protein